ncbi:MAG TPA: high-potential iron-sulfur protein [Steroidobacteraceae bacterium]|jgi:hypothetical protein|nr:high-potential iron-sulfur protein [Steroidobacteraceae bacterium]
MSELSNPHRRNTLKALLYGTLATTVISRRSEAADAPLVSEEDPTAKALHYVTDVHRAKDAKPGSMCSNCSVYTGDRKAAQGPCSIFAGKQVKAGGWCSAWVAVSK